MFDSIKTGFRSLLRLGSGKKPLPKRRQAESQSNRRNIRASYDASKTSPENERHWSNATDKPAAWENTPDVRRKLRMRARYEADNNCYACGMVSTLSTDTVGYIAPKLQVLTADAEFNSFIERKWEEWSTHHLVNLPSKLRIMDEGKRIEGENFLCLVNDEEIRQETEISLGVLNIGSSRVTDPYWGHGTIKDGLYNDDGIMIDPSTGRVKYYTVVPAYQELLYGSSALFESNPLKIPARYMLHWFAPRRAGQFRGVSELTPALPLFAQLRRYDLATLTAAETAALLAGIMKTNTPVPEPALVTDWTKTELERGTLLTLPDGWDATQFKPEQPVTAYQMFVDCVLRQIGRALDIPFGVVAGDSSKYNYSSARLDYTGYDERLKFDRQQLVIRILDRLFAEWVLELARSIPRVGTVFNALRGIPHTWQFTKRPSIDPEKDARTATEKINNRTSNLAIECAKDGNNWEEVLTQRANEEKKISELGLTSEQTSDIMVDNGTVA